MSNTFSYTEKTWEEFWAEFWRIKLLANDDAAIIKCEQVVDVCFHVLQMEPGMTLLDLGCGAGMQANLFAERGIEAHGIDLSPTLVKYAQDQASDRGLKTTFAAGDMRDFTVDEPYDRVTVLGMSFGFGTDEENEQTLHNIWDATKAGGKILLTGQHPYTISAHLGPEWMELEDGFLLHRGDFDPISCRLGGPWQLVCPDGTVVLEGENPEADGIRCYSVPELRKLLTDIGFTNVEFYGTWFLPPSELQWFSMELILSADKPK
ncbi:class I SAM-dependent methyltransferase [bacterium]|nr:class I SAM-dependent methyltransferase [bacterium]MBU1638299.1 class I SAM-dependent methyltransferase [bacterium]MBU1919201.1 class I SAM-dependent methyltransferase [bacterium]